MGVGGGGDMRHRRKKKVETGEDINRKSKWEMKWGGLSAGGREERRGREERGDGHKVHTYLECHSACLARIGTPHPPLPQASVPPPPPKPKGDETHSLVYG